MEDIYCSFNDSADTIKKKKHFNFDCWPKNTCFKKLKGKTKIIKKLYRWLDTRGDLYVHVYFVSYYIYAYQLWYFF